MTISQLLSKEIGDSFSVFNEPFNYAGRANIELDDGTETMWLYSSDEGMLTVIPEEEELVLFEQIHEEIEPSEMVLFQGDEYEFSYEAAGRIVSIDGESLAEENDRVMFSDYETQDGGSLLIVSNQNTGELSTYVGRTVSEDDIVEL